MIDGVQGTDPGAYETISDSCKAEPLRDLVNERHKKDLVTFIPYSDQTFAQKQPGVSTCHPEKKYGGFVHAETCKDGYFS